MRCSMIPDVRKMPEPITLPITNKTALEKPM